MAKGPKGLSCFEKKTAKHFLKWKKKFKNLDIPGKLYKDYFQLNNNLLKMPSSICFSTFCEPIQKVVLKGSVSWDFLSPFFSWFEQIWAPDKQGKVFCNLVSISFCTPWSQNHNLWESLDAFNLNQSGPFRYLNPCGLVTMFVTLQERPVRAIKCTLAAWRTGEVPHIFAPNV